LRPQRRILEAVDDRPAGLDADSLAERAVIRRSSRPLSPEQLSSWLLTQGLATEENGLLRATRRGLELAGGLRELQGSDPHARSWTRRG
jgi:hypothetical protein